IKHFDKKIKCKVNSLWQLLLINEHISHYILEFLEYACNHYIEIIYYSFHSIHIYQGFNVIIFSILKIRWFEM
ncbi:hypothetical protein BDZ89DRAFT_958238, partial [Hymenopellis radicata]